MAKSPLFVPLTTGGISRLFQRRVVALISTPAARLVHSGPRVVPLIFTPPGELVLPGPRLVSLLSTPLMGLVLLGPRVNPFVSPLALGLVQPDPGVVPLISKFADGLVLLGLVVAPPAAGSAQPGSAVVPLLSASLVGPGLIQLATTRAVGLVPSVVVPLIWKGGSEKLRLGVEVASRVRFRTILTVSSVSSSLPEDSDIKEVLRREIQVLKVYPVDRSKFLVWPGLIFDSFYHCCQA